MLINQIIPVYNQSSEKRSLSGAVEWPYWPLFVGHEPSAFESLANYAVRYARVPQCARIKPRGTERLAE